MYHKAARAKVSWTESHFYVNQINRLKAQFLKAVESFKEITEGESEVMVNTWSRNYKQEQRDKLGKVRQYS